MAKIDQKTINTADALNQAYIAPEIVRQRQQTIQALNIKSGESILDIGCGTGFLTYEMALIVGEQGNVTARDIGQSMVDHTLERCASLAQVNAAVGDVTSLDLDEGSFDVVTCTQVLLYVEDTAAALKEMHRVLKPGGRIAVLETDWRGVVMSSNYPEITEAIMKAWDRVVASPNLPPKLSKKMQQQGFHAINAQAIPLLNTSYSKNSFAVNSFEGLCKNAYKMDYISKDQGKMWMDDLVELGANDDYLFCVNRFLFTGVKI